MIRVYAGQPADDSQEKPSQGLTACLLHTWHTRPWALAVAERQLREYADNPPGRLRLRLGEFYSVADAGLPESRIKHWLYCLADRIRHSIEQGGCPPLVVPAPHWEWHACFPERSVPRRLVLPGQAGRVRRPRRRCRRLPGYDRHAVDRQAGR